MRAASGVVAATVSGYEVALAAHILAILAAYSAPLTYPLLLPYLRRHHPAALPGVHAVQVWLNTRVAPPASTAIVAAGAYMAFTEDLWSEAWLLVGIGLFASMSVVGIVRIIPLTRRLAELSMAGAHHRTPGGPEPGGEYERVYRQYMATEVSLGLLVVVAVFVMATKPI